MAIKNSDGSIVLSTKIDTGGIKKGLSAIKTGFATIATAAATAAVAVTKMAVSAYAEYEQLVGGVETLFKNSADKVLAYANNAFATAGMSANQYMETVTSFSAAMINSLGGDTEKAADYSNDAIIAMSDNANKMGTEIDSIIATYQSLSRGNVAMLDNLKLGYGGTKAELERLIADAEAYKASMGEIVDYDSSNFADVTKAIGAIQEKLGIAGATALEAETTIAGSANMTKAAWENVLTAISGGGDIDAAINNLVYSIQKYFENIVPVVERALGGIGVLIEKSAPLLVETIARALIQAIPSLITAVYQMILGLASGIYQGIIALFAGGTVKALEKQTTEIEKSAENQALLNEEIEETNKQVNKSLAGFDELNNISKDTADSAGAGANMVIPSGIGGIGGQIDGSAYENEIDETLGAIMATVGLSLVAIGLILLFSGSIAWGIGFIIGGALSFITGAAELSKTDVGKEVLSVLAQIMGAVGGALIAIGIILIMLGSVATGVGLIVAGAVLLIGSIGTLVGFNIAEVQNVLSTIMTIAGGAMLALGIILCVFAGPTPISIGLIVAGAISLVSGVGLNFGAIVDAIKGPIGAIMAIAGAAMLVLGIILCATGVGIGLGVALIAAGAISLVTPIALNWDAIVDWIKGVWDAVVGFWDRYIAPIFTAKFWLDLAKTCGNGLIAGFEGAINGIIWLFEGLINLVVSGLNFFIKGISKVTGAVGDLIGINLRIPEIPKASLGRVSIPRLAQGAVIPGGKEFLAVLGDQPSGQTNIEAPLDTIKQALIEAMAQTNNRDDRPIIIQVDGREIARANRSGESRMGKQTVTGGFANVY